MGALTRSPLLRPRAPYNEITNDTNAMPKNDFAYRPNKVFPQESRVKVDAAA